MADQWSPSDSGATLVAPAPSSTPKPWSPADSGAQLVSASPQDENFDPSKAGATLTDPDQIKARVASDPTYTPTDPELRLLYQQEQNQTLGQKAGSMVKGVGQGIASTAHDLVVSPIKGAGEFIQDPSAGRAAATMLEGPSEAASGIVGMVTKPFRNLYQDYEENPKAALLKSVGGPLLGNYLANKFAPDTPQQAEQRYQDWRDNYQTQLALSRGPGIAKSFTDAVTGDSLPEKANPEPYKEATRAVATYSALPMFEGGLRAVGLAGAPAAAASGEAGVGAKTIAAGAKATAATGRGMQFLGALPENVAKWVTGKVAGSPELADKVAKYVDMGETLSIPAAAMGGEPLLKALAATKGLEAGGKIASGLGDFAARVAEADPAQPLGRFYALAQDKLAPQWMREVASSPIVQAAAKLGRLGVAATKGAAEGAAVGGVTGALSGDDSEELGESIGSGAAFGGSLGLLHGPAAQIREKQLGALAQFVQQHLDAGISPETLREVDSSTALQAATLQKFLKDKKIMFSGPQDLGSPFAPGGAAEGQGGWFDINHKTLWVNPFNRPAAEVLPHEFFHDVWKSGIVSHPEIKKAFDTSLAANGKTLDDAKTAYAEAATGYKNDAAVREDFINSREASDPDWIYDELLADAAGRNLYKVDPVDLAKGAKFNQPQLGGTIFKGFEPVFDAPAIRRLSLRTFKDYVDYRPGIDEPVEQSAPLTKADLGTSKAPFYQTAAGQSINPYGQLVPDGKGGQKFISWPASEVRRRLKTEQTALDKYFPKGQPVTQIPDAALQDENIAPWTRTALKAVSDAIKSGEARELDYHRLNKENSSTSSKSWAADVTRNLGNVQVSHQSGFPLGLERTKQGNLITRWASLEAARQKAQVWAERNGDLSLDLWGGDQAKFFADSQRYLQNHKEGLPGDANNIGQAKRDVLNAFWFGQNREYQAKNPLRTQLKKSDRAGVFRSLRVDRMESMNPTDETGFVPPDYEKGKQNLSPAADNGAAARLQDLKTKTERTPEEEKEFQNLQGQSEQNNSKTAWASFLKRANPESAAASIVDQAAKERQFSPSARNVIDNKEPDDVKSGNMERRRKAMSVGKPLTVFHFSDASNGLDNIDPEKMRSKTTRFWGEMPKSFFWTKGSEKPIESEFGNGSFPDRYLYKSEIDGTKVYDARNASKDPLGYFDTWETDKNALDQKLKEAGFDGVLVSTKDGREVVVMLKKVPTKLVGVTDHDGKILKGKKDLLPPAKRKAFEIPKLDEPDQNHQDADARWDELNGKESLTKAEQKEMTALTNGTWTEKYGAKEGKGQQFSPSTDPRAVRAAAVRDEDGKVYDGLYHAAAAAKYWDTKFPGDQNNELRAWNSVPELEEGFVTNQGEFLNREQAYDRAVELKQYEPAKADDGQLESGRLMDQKKAQAQPAGAFSPMYDLDSIVSMNASKQEKTNDDPTYRDSSYLRSGKGIVLHSAALRSTSFIEGREADKFEKKYNSLKSKPARNALIESYFSPSSEPSKDTAQAVKPTADAAWEKKAGRYAGRIAALTVKNGGATFNPSTGQSYTGGKDPLFVVSIYPDRTVKLPSDQVTPSVIGNFIKDNGDLLRNKENSIGTWKGPDGMVSLDVSFVTPNRAMAEFAGKQYNQEAIWDLKKSENISTGGDGTTVPDMAPPAERLGMLKELFDESQKIPTEQVKGPLPVAVPSGSGPRANVRSFKEVENLDLEHVLTSKDMQPFARKVIQHFRKLPGFHGLPAALDAGLREIAKRMQDNIKFLYEKTTPEERENWRKWYDYAKDMSQRWGDEFGLPMDVVAAINARLSPQMDWYKNVTLTRTILQTLKDDPKFTAGDREFLEEKFSQIKKASDRKMWMSELAGIKDGTPLSEMNDKQAGMFLRSHNEIKGILKTHDHNLQPIEGITGWSKPFDDLRSVVSIYRDPSARNVHEELGKNHKVRSFYNNHVAPESPKWTTIDTHAVAAANMYPLGGSDEPVKANFGNPRHKNSGYNGTYFLYQHAYEQLAKEVGLLPREMQSIVWEKIRQVLSPERKRSLQKDMSPVDAIYADLRAKKITPEEGRQRLLDIFKNVDQKEKNDKLSDSEHGEE